MIGLGAKFLVTSIVGAGSVVGWASFSTPNWDPPHLWRIKSGSKFYLSSCFNNPYSRDGQTTYSDLWIYLTVKDSVSDIKEDAELELRAQGYSKKMKGTKLHVPTQYTDKSLQGSVNGEGGTSTDYEIRKQTRIQLGETGGGEDSEIFGSNIDCHSKIFDLSGSEGEMIILPLNKVTFRLVNDVDGQLKNKYTSKGQKVYSIKIETQGGTNKLQWANGFKPIVIF